MGQYIFENIDTGNQCVPLNDGTQKIFLYTKGKCDNVHPEIAGFLRYGNNGPPTGYLATMVDQRVQTIRNSNKHRESYMTLAALLDDRERKGRTEGREEERENTVKTLLRNGFSVSEIVSLFDFSNEYVEEIAKNRTMAQA